jgi:hypothetical protein
VDCGYGTFHHQGDREDGVPLCRICEYRRGLVGVRAVGVEASGIVGGVKE